MLFEAMKKSIYTDLVDIMPFDLTSISQYIHRK